MSTLLEAWNRLAQRAELRDADAIGADLIGRYAEPHRAYHTGGHVAQVLATLEEANAAPGALLAAWFHDAVYDPRRSDNEARSAELARDALGRAGCSAATVDWVASAVLATAAHRADDPDVELLLDADLAILAAPPAGYASYRAAIRREYVHVSDARFAAGRLAFVRAMLARERIFRTRFGLERFELAARANLARERDELEAGATCA